VLGVFAPGLIDEHLVVDLQIAHRLTTCPASFRSTLETLTYHKDYEAHLFTPVEFSPLFAYTGPASSILQRSQSCGFADVRD
jgi:hypothetical protein